MDDYLTKGQKFPEVVERYENLQTVIKLREMIRRLWHIAVSFVNEDGFVIDHARGRISPSRNQFCHKCLFDRDGLKKCDQTVVDITTKLKSGEFPNGGVFNDCHIGFKYAAVPVRLNGRFLGSVIAGGFLTSPLTDSDKETILAKSGQFNGATIADVEIAFDEIPLLSDADLRFFMETVQFGIEEIKLFHETVSKREIEIRRLNDALEERYAFHHIMGHSPAMRQLYELLDKLSESEATVLIEGENGTGKEMVARAIHYNSPRRDRRFVSQNCSAFNENLLDSEFFGHIKGSFTGAIRDKKGLFEIADGGTFFMDEIGDMSPALQVKLLRVLQEGSFIPVGATEPKHIDVRIIAATNQNLKKMVEEGTFREDLFYRLNVINAHVPPLRERREDIPLLIEHFLNKYSKNPRDKTKRFSPEAVDALMAFNWPGNVRQLENEVQRTMVMAATEDLITREMLSNPIRSTTIFNDRIKLTGKLRDAMEQLEREMLLEGLRRNRWNKSKLSRELGISRVTLLGKIEKYGLTRESSLRSATA